MDTAPWIKYCVSLRYSAEFAAYSDDIMDDR